MVTKAKIMNIIKPSSPMRIKPKHTSGLETECLFGEIVEILDINMDWYLCKLVTDNYVGWVHKQDLGYLPLPTHRVISLRSFLYESKDIKSYFILYVPLGAQLSIRRIEDEWAVVSLSEKNKDIAYIPIDDIVALDNVIYDWVGIAELCLSTPYKWGGRDTIGIDCSALLQLSYQTYGQIIPRNTSEQVKLKKTTLKKIENLKRGCVVFWKSHVGIMTDKINCIHANAFYMKTVTEPLINIINRLDKNHGIIKMMDFN